MTVGLATLAGTAIPLESIAIRGELVAGHALLRFVQTYRSNASVPIEAIYTFPLPAEGAVVDFRYRCGGRELTGELREREAAFREYDEAVREGHGAALVERERDDVFTASVGNLLPGETVEIEVEVLLPLDFVDGKLRLKIPTLVPPRYVPGRPGGPRTGLGAADPTELVPDADRITPTTAPNGDPGYRASLDLRVRLGFPTAIDSPSHGVLAQLERDFSVVVRFAGEHAALDRDLVLRLQTRRPFDERTFPGLVCERSGDGAGTFALGYVPDFTGYQGAKRPLDVVFVLDRSGSMGGASIVEARRALGACLRQLRGGDRFEIVAFDTEIETFSFAGSHHRSARLVDFSEEALDRATRWIAGIDARGGTELGRALDFALPLVPGGTLVLLTDAQVGDEDLVAARFAKDLARPGSLPRVLSFGIGTNVAGGLLAELARATGGAVEEIHPGESIEEKVLAQFARAVSTRVEELEITITGIETTDLVPSAAAFTDNEPFVLLGRYTQPGRGLLVFTGRRDGEPYHLEMPLNLPARAATEGLPGALTRVWAARRIAALERERAALGNPRRAKALSERIVALSLEHRVMCRETAFVVVEKREGDRRRPGAPQTVVVPVHAPAGWEMPMPQDAAVLHSSLHLSAPAGPPRGGRHKAPALSRELRREPLYDLVLSDEVGFSQPSSTSPFDADSIFAAQLPSGLWDEPALGAPGEERLLRATLARLLDLLVLGVDTDDEASSAPLELALGALLELLDRSPAADAAVVGLYLRIALLLAPTGALRPELVARARAARLTRSLRKDPIELRLELVAVTARVARSRQWPELARDHRALVLSL